MRPSAASSRNSRPIDFTSPARLTISESLLKEILSYGKDDKPPHLDHSVLVPLQIRCSLGLLSFFSTTTVFGTPVDVTLSELAIEMFFPADEATARAVRGGRGSAA